MVEMEPPDEGPGRAADALRAAESDAREAMAWWPLLALVLPCCSSDARVGTAGLRCNARLVLLACAPPPPPAPTLPAPTLPLLPREEVDARSEPDQAAAATARVVAVLGDARAMAADAVRLR
jgi:hypothetical protein